MTMRNESFAAFILTHGRPDRVHTYAALRKHGYTGRIVLICDDEDKTIDAYRERYGDEVVVFDKRAAAAYTDDGDNHGHRRGVVYARNATFGIARELGVAHFIMLDDDYRYFRHKRDDRGEYCGAWIRDLDAVLDAMVDFLRTTPVLTITMAQAGDFIGGKNCTTREKPKRKAMNTFVCATDRPFRFLGRLNEDVNAYVDGGARGGIYLMQPAVSVDQIMTQKNPGGLTELYLDSGTYVKSFYSVMYQPSSCSIGLLDRMRNARIHHKIRWRYTVPVILPESTRKPSPR